MFFKIIVLKNFTIFTRKRLCQSPIFNKVAVLSLSSVLRFPVNFTNLFRTTILQNTPRRLLLLYQGFGIIFRMIEIDVKDRFH